MSHVVYSSWDVRIRFHCYLLTDRSGGLPAQKIADIAITYEEIRMKFDMGASTLSTLTKQTSGSNDDLGGLVKELVVAAEPLEGKFNGTARAAFDGFKERTDDIAAELNGALSAILGGVVGMDTAFVRGEQDMVESTRSAQSSANFDAARFGAGRA